MGDIVDFKAKAGELPPDDMPEFARGQDFGFALGDAAILSMGACHNCRKDFAAGALLAFRDALLQPLDPEDREHVAHFVATAPIADFPADDDPVPPPAA